MKKILLIFVFLGLLVPAQAQSHGAITGDSALIAIAQEEYNAIFATAGTTDAFTITFTGTQDTAEVKVGVAGATMEIHVAGSAVKIDGDSTEIVLATYFDSGAKTFQDLANTLNSAANITCVIGEHMPPWMYDAKKLKTGTTTLTKNVATGVPAGYMIAAKAPADGVRKIVVSRGFKLHPTFGSGTGHYDIYSYDSINGETRLFRQPLATATAVQYKNDEFRVDAARNKDVYYVIDLSGIDPNASNDYIIQTYSYFRR